METIIVIFKKELIDVIRDRRTIIAMVLFPLLIFPVLMGISSKFLKFVVEGEKTKVLNIGLITNNNVEGFKQILESKENLKIIEEIQIDSCKSHIQSGELDLAIEVNPDFDQQLSNLLTGNITLYYKSVEGRNIACKRVLKTLNEYKRNLRSIRFKKLKLDESVFDTVNIIEKNLVSAGKQLSSRIGGLIPYIFIIFCFLGSMYPAIDLAAGEKERGTLETLLTTPANRLQILLGKFGVVVLAGILSVVVSMIGLYVGFLQMKGLPNELVQTVLNVIQFKSMALVISLIIPLTAFTSGFLLSLSMFARSFKEAQSIMTPFQFIFLIVAFLPVIPGLELNTATALIPILNVALAIKAILSGTAETIVLFEVYLSLFFIAGLSLYVCSKVFKYETVIFRSS